MHDSDTGEGEFDYIVVGGGSAGCVVAARLSESGRHSVALVEAGGQDRSFWIHMPLGYGRLYDHAKLNWSYESEPEAGLCGARSFQPRGKVLGGTGSINMMVYVRGQRQDFDYWRSLGNVGWSYDDVLPVFRKAESFQGGDGDYHGTQGPLPITIVPRHDLADAFINAGIEAGYPLNNDFNGALQDGFGYDQVNILNGRRQSTAVAYLRPARCRSNLAILTDALVSRIVIEDGEAVGIEIRRGGTTQTIRARGEVVLCAGTFNSPQLLQLSGIGPAEFLSQTGIHVVADLPGVGRNLQDHFNVALTYRCSRPITVSDAMRSPWSKAKAGLQYLLLRRGILASNGTAGGAFIRTDPNLGSPDVKLRLRLWSRATTTSAAGSTTLTSFSSVGLSTALLHPESRGSVVIRSADPTAPPSIHFDFFNALADHERAVTAVGIMRRIMTMPAIAPFLSGEVTPGPQCKSSHEIVDFCRRTGTSGFHASGTCRMGVGNDDVVVDPRLCVRNIRGLRVADASIMPRIVGANTNATTIMIGEKAAAMMLEDARSL